MEPGAFIDLVSGLGPVGLGALFTWALLSGRLVLPREVAQRDARIAELTRERDEFKRLAYQALRVGERAADAAAGTENK